MRSTSNFILLILLFQLAPALTNTAIAEPEELWAKIRIHVADQGYLDHLIRMGVDMEGASGRIGGPMDFVVPESVLEELEREAIGYAVVIPDLATYYANRLASGPVNALGFGYGSMGGFYTLEEVRQQLDSLRLLHPNIVGKRDSIGASLQGRPIWAVRMTVNPDLPSDRPQALYFAMQHAREPIGMMTLLYFMWYLAEHYGGDPEATYLLENRDLWFVPVVNVDGYEANRRMMPGGGGMRRKNMRNVVTDGDRNGVDLNRNWGWNWGYDDIGSNPDPLHYGYRGTGPFSEPESQVLGDFCSSKSFRFVMEYHSHMNALMGPTGESMGETADSLQFREYFYELTRKNRYMYWPLRGYINGDAISWAYHNPPAGGRVFPFVIEIGGDQDGFWPATDRILPLVTENLYGNLFAAWAAGEFPTLQSYSVRDSSGEGDLEPGESFTVDMRLHNFGQDVTGPLSVSAVSLTSDIEVYSGAALVATLEPHMDTVVSVQGRIGASVLGGTWARMLLTISSGNRFQRSDTVSFVLGESNIVLADGAEEGMSSWSVAGTWGRSVDSYSGDWCFTDSPSGNYRNNSDNMMTLLSPLYIPDATAVTRLQFWTRWMIQPIDDFGHVYVSIDSGRTWTELSGDLTRRSEDTPGNWGYTSEAPAWRKEDIELTGLEGEEILLRFLLSSGRSVTDDGWYVDDISVRCYLGATTAVSDDLDASVPETFALHQNYPNPFNPSTTMEFVLPHAGYVTLKVYNLLGEAVATLVEGDHAAGTFNTTWDASGLPSGVYFYRLTAGEYVQTRKAVLMR